MTHTTVDASELKKFSDLADSWWDENGPFKHLHLMNKPRIKYIKQHIDLQGSNILDVGCGGGILSVPLHRLGANVTGLDAEINNIEIARAYAHDNGYNINYVHSAIEDFQDKRFDIVCALEIIEHVADISLFIQSLTNVVADNGLLFISTINKTTKSYLQTIMVAEYLLRMVPVGTHEWGKFVKPSVLHNILLEHGFDVINISGMKYNPLVSEWYLDQDVTVNYIMVAKKR